MTRWGGRRLGRTTLSGESALLSVLSIRSGLTEVELVICGACLAVIRPRNCRKSVAGDEIGSARSHHRRLAEALPAERK